MYKNPLMAIHFSIELIIFNSIYFSWLRRVLCNMNIVAIANIYGDLLCSGLPRSASCVLCTLSLLTFTVTPGGRDRCCLCGSRGLARVRTRLLDFYSLGREPIRKTVPQPSSMCTPFPSHPNASLSSAFLSWSCSSSIFSCLSLDLIHILWGLPQVLAPWKVTYLPLMDGIPIS